jgi:glycosyltransferase involved in cell wall biosynthesis
MAMAPWKLRLLRALHLLVTLLLLLTLAFLLLGAAVFCSSAASDNAERFWARHLWSHVGGRGGRDGSWFDKIMFETPSAQSAQSVQSHDRHERRDLAADPPVSFSLQWHLPVGCDWSGFFVEGLGFGVGLARAVGEDAFALSVGACSEEMLAQLTEAEQRLVSRRAPLDAMAHEYHAVVLHKRPGRDFVLPPSRRRARRGAADLVIGRMMTESAKLPLRESRQAEQVDEVWVPTEWHRGVFQHAGVDPVKIRVMPEPVDTVFFDPKKAHANSLANTNTAAAAALEPASGDVITRFVSVFKWEHRKGWDVLLDAFWTAFDRDDPVELHMRTYKPSWEPGTKNIDTIIEQHARAFLKRQVSEHDNTSRRVLPIVRWERKDLSRKELRAFYHAASAFVLPTRGEGWCLPAVEAMSMALPVIVTNFSGPSAYLSTSHAYPVGVAAALNRDGTAEPLVADVIAALRQVAARPKDASMVGRRARQWVQAHLDTDVVARRVKKSIILSLQKQARDGTVRAEAIEL